MAFIVSVMANLICIYWRFVLKFTHICTCTYIHTCGEGQIAACAAAASYIRGVIESDSVTLLCIVLYTQTNFTATYDTINHSLPN